MNIQRRPHPTMRQRLMCYLSILLMVTFTGVGVPAVYADETTPTPTETTQATETTEPTTTEPAPVAEPVIAPSTTETTTPPPESTQGPQSPTGADSDSYTYNETTGLWENSKYTWNPVTKQTSPKDTPTYSYNPETGHWDTTEWIYDAPSGQYVPNVISALAPPEGAVLDTSQGAPSATNDTGAGAGDTGTPSPLSTLLSSGQTGPGSDNSIESNSSSTGIFDLFYNAVISNNLDSSAITGDALVSMNTLAGNALSGDATAIATVFNLLHSLWNLGVTGNTFSTFTQNIFGNVIGDLWFQGPDSTNTVDSTSTSDLTINASQDAAINNTINLEAISGDATVTKNTTAGDATTGSATVIANIINAINSAIVSGSSFVGMLNIYGSLDGDILLPEDLISTLLASNTLGTLDTSQISNTSILGEFNNDLSTANNVNATATSGDATVDSNTAAGNATTGDAETNITLLNLTGREVVGSNALLVFVNVLGTWVGMIVDAPTGTTSAAFGGNITENNTLEITQNNNQAITNDINAHATSGDALVSNNTRAGDATTGDAMAAVNILNMNNSQFALTDWFGVLFINVFGTWNGSFGLDTLAGTLSLPAIPTPISAPSGSPSVLGVNEENIRAYRFVPNSSTGTYSLESSDDGVAALVDAQVLGSIETPTPGKKTSAASLATATPPQRDWTLTVVGMTVGLSLLGAERVLNRRSK